jgi:hypothetical protein
MKADFNITLMIVSAQLIMCVFDPSLAEFVPYAPSSTLNTIDCQIVMESTTIPSNTYSRP